MSAKTIGTLALLAIFVLAAPLASAPICEFPVTLYGTLGCKVGDTAEECATTAGAQLTYLQFEKNLRNILSVCQIKAEDLATECADGQGFVASNGAVVCGLSGPATYAGSATAGGVATSALAVAGTPAAATVYAGPASGAAAAPTFRLLAATDLPATITSNTTGNAATASALAADPPDCDSGEFATAIGPDGALTCATPAGGGGVSGPEASTDRAVAVWSGADGLSLLNSGVTLGLDSEHRLLWSNGLGLLESGSDLYIKTGVNYAWSWGTAGHFCGWGASNGPCMRLLAGGVEGSVPFTFTGDQNTGVGSPAADQVSLYAGGVRALTATAASVSMMELHLAPQASPSAACDASLRGRIYYDTSDAFCGCDGTTWNKFSGAALGACT